MATEPISIPCPECGKELRLRDRSLLGRKGRCPNCRALFVLEEPVVDLELIEPPPSPDVSFASADDPDTPPASVASSPPVNSPPEGAPFFAPEGFAPAASTGSEIERLREIRRRAKRKRNLGILVGGIAAASIFAVFVALQGSSEPQPVAKQKPAAPKTVAEPAAASAASRRSDTEFYRHIAAYPDGGQPVQLQMVPAGARIIFHLRPAELWRDVDSMNELRASLGPLAQWAQTKLKEVCRREPQQIAEALVCLYFTEPDQPPEIAAVVRLTEPARQSELLEEFQGEFVDEYGPPVYVGTKWAYHIHDLSTFSICPSDRAREMIDSKTVPSPTSVNLEQLLIQTDRTRQFTVLLEPNDLLYYSPGLVPEALRPAIEQFAEWFGDEVESVAWTLHLDHERLFSEMLCRHRVGGQRTMTTSAAVRKDLEAGLNAVPVRLLGAARHMNPQRLGYRRIIGRFPAMMQAWAMATELTTGERQVRLLTVLPERAAPNLAIGALLAWDESTRTDFSTPAPPTVTRKLPERVEDRLRLRIDAEFARIPLQDVMNFVASEIQIPVEIDGDALKFAGYTKNMPQTFKLEQVPVSAVLHTVVKQYDKMCVVVDEKQKKILLTTLSFAEDQGLTPYPLEPPGT